MDKITTLNLETDSSISKLLLNSATELASLAEKSTENILEELRKAKTILEEKTSHLDELAEKLYLDQIESAKLEAERAYEQIKTSKDIDERKMWIATYYSALEKIEIARQLAQQEIKVKQEKNEQEKQRIIVKQEKIENGNSIGLWVGASITGAAGIGLIIYSIVKALKK